MDEQFDHTGMERESGQNEGQIRECFFGINRCESIYIAAMDGAAAGAGVQLKVMSPPESFLFILYLSSFSLPCLTKDKDKEERRKRE
ncbi:hypothetical protein OH491_19895 [Termitidicoccus mucosus]|uniref:hypothetical protein n=1 Tax=Termitidicoccus mucosus TaxID=1184151 RepID=UPI002FEE3B02